MMRFRQILKQIFELLKIKLGNNDKKTAFPSSGLTFILEEVKCTYIIGRRYVVTRRCDATKLAED